MHLYLALNEVEEEHVIGKESPPIAESREYLTEMSLEDRRHLTESRGGEIHPAEQ